MTDGNNFDYSFFDPIDNPIVAINLFSDILIFIFRNYPARFRKLREFFDCLDNFFGKKDGVLFGVFRNISADFLKIGRSPW